MITFHSRRSDCARHVRKNENFGTFNFTSRCSRTAVSDRFRMGQALPLIFIRLSRLANSSPTNRRNPARRSHNGREPSHKNSGEMSRSLPHNFPAIAGRCKSQCRRISARATCEITRNAARNGLTTSASQSAQQTMQHPAKHPTSRLVEVLASRFQP
jgi:hypothetical protein